MIPIKDIQIKEKTTVDELVRQMNDSGGFTSKKLATGIDIVEKMIKDRESLNFLSFPACIIATGTRGVIKEFVKRNWFGVLITTCGTLDHDLARSFEDYFHGNFDVDDKELHKKEIQRIGNVFTTTKSYGLIIEKKMREILKELSAEGKKELSVYELAWEIGKRIENEDSILYWCYKNKIPVIIPGVTDGAVGYHLWQYSQNHDFKVNVLKDEQLLADLTWKAKKSGGLIIGGGISKHHTIWWNQFKNGLDYAVYVTTAAEYDGSLSGARPKEAVSWGKINEDASFTCIEEDATIALPIMFASLLERIKD